MKQLQPQRHSVDKLEISEIFHSLQGEGPFMGRPATFIRLSGCLPPLCPWCDTMHAQYAGSKRTIQHILNTCVAFNRNMIVITGGEPFLQWKTGLKFLEKSLLEKGFTIQYETSGKVEISGTTRGFIVCSPKFLDGKWHFLPENHRHVQAYKFVVEESYDPIESFIKTYKIPAEKIWIMAEGSKRETQLQKFASVWEYCVNNNYNFSPRLHVLTYDDKKGV